MKLHHLFETSQDDRQLISVSSAIATVLINLPTHRPQLVGTIGDMVSVGLAPSLAHIKIRIFSHEQLQQLIHGANAGYKEGEFQAVWDADADTIGVISDIIKHPNKLRIALTHELRHALDDIKSSGEAGYSVRYNSGDGSEQSYYTEPAELNARFAEAMHLLTGVIRRAYVENKATARAVALEQIPVLFNRRKIAQAFPDGTKAAAYRRLLSRGAQFVDFELARLAKRP